MTVLLLFLVLSAITVIGVMVSDIKSHLDALDTFIRFGLTEEDLAKLRDAHKAPDEV